MAGETKSLGQKDVADRFYTKGIIAKQCVDFAKNLLPKQELFFIEPSAGGGAFLPYLDNYIAYDLHPAAPNIIQANWFETTIHVDVAYVNVVIGNPPFGVQAKKAIDFFNRAALSADYIAFILPRSFRKDSIKNKLNQQFHLIGEWILPENSFTFEGKDYDVNCVFQVWEKRIEIRPIIKARTTTPYFDFTKDKSLATCSVRRVGAAAGKASKNLDYSEQSNYFIINKTSMNDDDFIDFLNKLAHDRAADAVGPKSLSKSELIEDFETAYKTD